MASFFFSQNPISKRVENMEAAVAGLEASTGLTPGHKRNAKGVLDALAAGRSAEQFSPTSVRGENQHFQVEGVSNNGDTREVHMQRKNESGMWEKVIAVEERVGENTFVTREVRHAR